jgi:hypothetical protein
MGSPDLYPGNAPLSRLIDALAKQSTADYLTAQKASERVNSRDVSKPVPLLPDAEAA